MSLIWDQWKKGFDVWEDATAKYIEAWMKSPFVLGPSGTLLAAAMKMKTVGDRAKEALWGEMGLPTKRDQERILHALHQLQSKVLDLEEKLEATRDA
jgi:hypothetical protein